jgi:uncharacterized protein YndB with AHSA1/START domain
MSDPTPETRSVIIERRLAHPPAKVWRALTLPHLLEEWLMQNDFELAVGHRFDFKAEWGAVTCEILEIEPQETLSYTWGDHNLKSVVTWTLTPTESGTLLRMEQTGFRPDQPRYFQGAQAGWPRFLENLEQLLGRLD